IMGAISYLDSKGRPDLKYGSVLLRRLGEDGLIEGLAIESLPQEAAFVENLGNCKVALIKDSLKAPLLGHAAEADKGSSDRESELLVSRLVASGINLIVSNAPEIDLHFKLALISNRISLIRVSTDELKILSRALRIRPNYAIDIMNESSPVQLTSVSRVEIDEENRLTILKNPSSGAIATLIVGGATVETSKERMRAVTDGISAAYFALKGGVVAGGGIAELNLARFLQKVMDEKGEHKPGYDVLIHGLESISRQIFDNCGFNGYESMIELKPQPDSMGIDIETGAFINMVSGGIVDPLITKINAILVAVHIAKTILKIDKNLLKAEDEENAAVRAHAST
ncbi:MAG: TCP-1/cpn60 chaperonin family protein, partial [Rhabdochlamydiaceae bacterium]